MTHAATEAAIDARNLLDVPIVAFHGGTRVGRITDVLLATDPLRVAALYSSDEWSDSMIPFERVDGVGASGVTVADATSDDRWYPDDAPNTLRLRDVCQVKVVDESGEYLGRIMAVEFDAVSGKVEQLRALLRGPLDIPEQAIVLVPDEVRIIAGDSVTVVRLGLAATK